MELNPPNKSTVSGCNLRKAEAAFGPAHLCIVLAFDELIQGSSAAGQQRGAEEV
jgi:hypothetical protein